MLTIIQRFINKLLDKLKPKNNTNLRQIKPDLKFNDLSFLDQNIAYGVDGELLTWNGKLYIGESGQTLTLDEIEELEEEDVII